jgi:oligoendopeptidase F
MDVEMQNRRYRDLLFRCDEEFLKVERKEEEMVSKLEVERMGYDRMKTFYETREQSLRKEIANLKDKVGEAELRHDYLESKVLECEDRIERQRLTLREFHEKEKQRGIRKLALEAHCNTMEKLAVEAAVTTTYNMHHLVHYIKSTEYPQDKVNRISQAWIDADRKRVQKIRSALQDVPLPVMRKKPRRQPFHVEATMLNFKACPTEGYSEVPRTEMLDYALTYVARIHRSDDKLRAMEGTPEAFTSGPSASPITLGQE